MKIIFAALKYDYGIPNRGLSVEYTNFYETLIHMPGIEAEFFAIDEITLKVGRAAMSVQLISLVQEKKPDLLFCYLLSDELDYETIAFITTQTSTKTFNWFADDHWRVPVFSRYWAPLFTNVSTTDSKALGIYKSYGITNVIKTQWAANPFLYKPQTTSEHEELPVTFVGKKFGNRGLYVEHMEQAHIPVKAFGSGWPLGRVEQQRMLEIFSHSKINLNFTETYNYGAKETMRSFAKLFIKKERGAYKFNGHHIVSNAKAVLSMRRLTIKGRTFEVPACGGFLLSGKSDDDVTEYYVPNKEIVIFTDESELIEKAQYYLEHETERLAIAQAGYERTIREHTYVHRFKEIFKTMALPYTYYKEEKENREKNR